MERRERGRSCRASRGGLGEHRQATSLQPRRCCASTSMPKSPSSSASGLYAAVPCWVSSATDVSRPERGSLCKPDEECASTASRRERSSAFSVPKKSPQPKSLKGSFSRTTTHTKVKQTPINMYICPLPTFPFCFGIPDVCPSFLSFAFLLLFFSFSLPRLLLLGLQSSED
jgi:hypothetical protein